MNQDPDRLHIINNAPSSGLQGVFNAPIFYNQISERPIDRNRMAMLEKVKSIWITGLLAHSLGGVARIDLDMTGQSDQVFFPLSVMVQELVEALPSPPRNTSMIELFTLYASQLLILGEPGTGKTTLLLELARDLIARAEQDSTHPIPVVFHLSAWAVARAPLADWLVQELIRAYDVPSTIARTWVDQQQLLLLLDGLDEMESQPRAACVDAINVYRQEHGLVQLAICSRTNEYQALGIKLRLQGAVLIQKLSTDRIEAYIHENSASLTQLATVLADNPQLWTLIDTPLMLHVMALAYQYGGIHIESSVAPDAQRLSIFGAYIDAMFRRHSQETRYSKQEIVGWLASLARYMKNHAQTVFSLEFMQPDWLPYAEQRRFNQYIGVLRGGLAGIAVGLFVGTFGFFAVAMLWSDISQLIGAPGLALNVATLALSTSVSSVGFGIALALIGLFAARHGKIEGISLVERLEWSPRSIRRAMLLGLGVGPLTGGIVGLVFGPLRGSLVAIVLALALGILMLARDAGWRNEEVRTIPNQGIGRSVRNALLMSLGAGLSSGAAIGLISSVFLSTTMSILFGIALGIAIGLFMWLFFGGETYIKHYLLRAMLARQRIVPWNFPQVLEIATNRILLHRLGGSYTFVHQLLMEYLATQP